MRPNRSFSRHNFSGTRIYTCYGSRIDFVGQWRSTTFDKNVHRTKFSNEAQVEMFSKHNTVLYF